MLKLSDLHVRTIRPGEPFTLDRGTFAVYEDGTTYLYRKVGNPRRELRALIREAFLADKFGRLTGKYPHYEVVTGWSYR